MFNVSWEAEKRIRKKFLNSKSIWRFDVNSVSLFSCMCHQQFFFAGGLFYCFIGKVFFRSTKVVPWRCSAKKYHKYLAKIIRKHLYGSLFASNFPGQGPVTLLKKELWHKCFPVNFGKHLCQSVRLVLKTLIL